MATRKHLSERTLRASLLVQLGLIPYEDAKKMTVDQVISLFHVDHNILHETGHPDRDAFWNLTHRLIKEHREKTKLDAAIIAKGRRIRNRQALIRAGEMLMTAVDENAGTSSDAAAQALAEGVIRALVAKPKIRSRGFDRRFRRKMSGKVVPR